MLRWFLQRFQESVEGRLGQHVYLINDIYFVFADLRRVFAWQNAGYPSEVADRPTKTKTINTVCRRSMQEPCLRGCVESILNRRNYI